MSHKRPAHDSPSQRAGGGDKRRRRRRKHLYLVLDDWHEGYSVHKIDAADGFDSDSDSDDEQSDRHLPDPPALRLESPVAHEGRRTDMTFAALGTKMFVFMNQRCGLVYDAGTAALTVGAHAPALMTCGFGVSVAVGDVLYALTHRFFDKQQRHSFQSMSWGPTAPDERQKPTEGWSWKTLPLPPFDGHVLCYALHPDGRTIFMTAADNGRRPVGTYSFDTEDSAWRFHGEWLLPFLGQAHFDAELEAWIGVHQQGYICACQVISPDFRSTAPCFYPDCKMTNEKMFRSMHSDRHMSVSLTRMGAAEFCLVEGVVANKVEERPTFGDYDSCGIHITVFGLRYNHRGELRIRDHQSSRSFIASRHRFHFYPKAFWM